MAAIAEKRKQKRTDAQASLAEPKAKKARLDSALGATKSSTDKGKKRSQPVTLPVKDDSDTSSDEGSEPELDEADEEVGDEELSQTSKDPNGAQRLWFYLRGSADYLPFVSC
jgi:pumilio homology domain family member 6